MRGRAQIRLTNFSGGVRRIDSSIVTTGSAKHGTSPTYGRQGTSANRAKREELLDARDVFYDRRLGVVRRRRPHDLIIGTSPNNITSIMAGTGFPAGDASQILYSDGPNIWNDLSAPLGAAIFTGLAAGGVWHSVMFPQSGGQGPMYLANGVNLRYWTGAAGGNWTAAAGTQPVPKYMVSHGGRIWAVCNTTLATVPVPLSSYAWSEINDARNWPNANVNMLDPYDGGELTGVGRVGPYLLIFKRRKTWLIYDLDTGANRQLSDSIGCISHRSICETPLGTFFMTERGPAICNGDQIKLLDDKLSLMTLINLNLPQSTLTQTINAVAYKDDVYLNIGGVKDPFMGDPGHKDYDMSVYDVINDAWWPWSRPMSALCVADLYGYQPVVVGVEQNGWPSYGNSGIVSLCTGNELENYDGYNSTGFGIYFPVMDNRARVRDLDFETDAAKMLRSVTVEMLGLCDPQFFINDERYDRPGVAIDYVYSNLGSGEESGRKTYPRPAAAGLAQRIGFEVLGSDTTQYPTTPWMLSAVTVHADIRAR